MKAKSKQAYLKLLLYGKSGSGKSFTSLLIAEGLSKRFGGRVAFVDSEFSSGGSDWYAQDIPARETHPEAFDFDRLETLSLKEAIQGIQALDPKEHSVIVIDSISHYWQAAIDAYSGKMVGSDADKIPINAWGKIKKPFKGDLVQWLISAPFHVIMCARQKNVYDTTGGDWTLSRVAPRAEGELEYEVPLEFRMYEHRTEGKASAWFAVVEKDRTGILSGRSIKNPSYATVEPIIAILGTEQRDAPDEDERLAIDSELMDAQKQKADIKAEKSAALLEEFTSAFLSAATVEALGGIAADLKKKRRYMLEEHLNALREIHGRRQTVLVEKVGGSV